MTDEIATADSGADTKPVDNTNISVTDFANRRLGQMTSQKTEEESQPVAEEPTEETTEEATEEVSESTETNEEVSQEETEVESTSEDVLSQIDLDNASEEELRELAEKLGSKAVARFGELTARRKAAEEKLAKLEAQMQKQSPLETNKKIENNPFSNLTTICRILMNTKFKIFRK